MIKKLLEVCDFQGGTQPPKDEWLSMPQEGYIRMLQIRDYTQGDEKFIEYVLDNGKLHKCTEEDIMLSRYGYIGQAFMGLSGAYNVALVKVIKKEDVLTKYLLYYFRSRYFQHHLTENVGARATIPGFNKSELKNAVIDIPSKERQAYIANVLSTIDEIIVQRQQELKTYDDLIKARFVEMFGDPETGTIFYPLKKLKELSVKISDGVHAKPSYTESGRPFLSVVNINKKKIDFTDCKYVSEEAYQKMIKSTYPQKGDILYTKVGATYGIPAYVDTDIEFCLYVSVCLIKPRHELINSRFLAMQMDMPFVKHQADKRIKGIGVPDLHLNQISDFDIVCPPRDEQDAFVSFVAQVDKSKFVQAITFLI